MTHSTAVPAGETLTHVITVEEDERITFSGVSDLPLTLYAKKDACPTATDYDFTVTTFGSDNDYSIETGCDNEAHMTAGNWYVMAEQAQGGESKMQGKGSVSSCKSTLSFILIGAGAKILGNIEVGCCSKVAAGSVVLKPVPPHSTVAGVPARVIGEAGCKEPARSMDQMVADCGDSG